MAYNRYIEELLGGCGKCGHHHDHSHGHNHHRGGRFTCECWEVKGRKHNHNACGSHHCRRKQKVELECRCWEK